MYVGVYAGPINVVNIIIVLVMFMFHIFLEGIFVVVIDDGFF